MVLEFFSAVGCCDWWVEALRPNPNIESENKTRET